MPEINVELHNRVVESFNDDECLPDLTFRTLPVEDQMAFIKVFSDYVRDTMEHYADLDLNNPLETMVIHAWVAGCNFASKYWLPWKR